MSRNHNRLRFFALLICCAAFVVGAAYLPALAAEVEEERQVRWRRRKLSRNPLQSRRWKR